MSQPETMSPDIIRRLPDGGWVIKGYETLLFNTRHDAETAQKLVHAVVHDIARRIAGSGP